MVRIVTELLLCNPCRLVHVRIEGPRTCRPELACEFFIIALSRYPAKGENVEMAATGFGFTGCIPTWVADDWLGIRRGR